MLNHQRELTLPRFTAAPTATSSAFFNTPVSVAQATGVEAVFDSEGYVVGSASDAGCNNSKMATLLRAIFDPLKARADAESSPGGGDVGGAGRASRASGSPPKKPPKTPTVKRLLATSFFAGAVLREDHFDAMYISKERLRRLSKLSARSQGVVPKSSPKAKARPCPL